MAVSTGAGEVSADKAVVGARAPDFALPDEAGRVVRLSAVLSEGPALLAFYPRDFTAVCTKQLCSYRDALADFRGLGIQVLGISPNATASHARFANEHAFKFRLLSDTKNVVARAYGCQSVFMLGMVSRAVFIVSPSGIVLYRKVEPTVVTHRGAGELLKVLTDLKSQNHLT